MNKIIGIIIGIVVLVGIGWFVMVRDDSSDTSDVVQDNNSNTGTVQNPTQARAPIVLADQKAIPTDTTAVVTGKVTPNGAITSYWYEYGTTPDMGKMTTRHMLGSGFSAISSPAYITGLTKDTTYYFRLNAENQFGKVSNGKHSFVTSSEFTPIVGKISTAKTLPATSITRTSADLHGEVLPNQADTQYWFEYGPTVNLGNISSFSSAGKGTATLPVAASLSNLSPSTTYYFRINSQNIFGTVNGVVLNFETSGPSNTAVPTASTVSATSVTDSTANLRGIVNAKGANTNYWFEYSTDSGFKASALKTTEKAAVGSGEIDVPVSAMASPLLSKTTYYFRVVAENSLGTTRGDSMNFKSK
ncbi:MAG: hypothetical protein A2741_00650 [Candidatus Zambryskibacteria bacterium RIFCSPHIGHO2_01_FULL_43_27]|uniref:Fibronectin type-III domain-containing protein n=1 Tax=Candidatus Zambryskibacteria bacterium RIFCSPLOWO2_01_FULL_43_17 TaxID=1802760 RepID=A0A1G2U4D7_9BACT|nr:MAG: hypothetical protein A2741_00650 [Candidatus Zambryskibacteria bacterium RIFCSPHIGHO2_01_FULL_43_27]OHB00308.1 MAG: hypothetical protein A3E93_00355 [Candidatus Zambryskibacteria bacterium RIFCSPHIGHO2_12_FULL_43_12b]OHB03780.1 MAG: hypothetical protein A2920_01870 [Candidatus Zambryskibacteria bacterium RIFCSPLOWO2_01_FULL_43_17]